MKSGRIFLGLLAAAVSLSSCEKNDRGNNGNNEDPTQLSGKLVFNEVNGTGEDADKYIELYNNSGVEISLEGVTIYYNNYDSESALTWSATDETLAARSYLLLKGTKNTTVGQETHALSTGLSGSQGIYLRLYDSGDNQIDFLRVPAESNREKTFARIPDGSGEWYYDNAAGTAGETNGTTVTDKNRILIIPVISNFKRDITLPSPSDQVTVSAAVSPEEGTLTSVVLSWAIDGTDQADITPQTAGDGYYSGTIPAQADGTVVTYTLSAVNANGTATASGTYTVSSATIDYSMLVINEVNGVTEPKWVEIYNTGAVAVNLEGVTLHYNNSDPANYKLTYTFESADVIDAGGWLANPKDLTTGLSANKANVSVQLRDPNGATLDTYAKPVDINSGYSSIKNVSHTRIPDGTGEWYYRVGDAAGSKNSSNGTSTAGYVKLGNETAAIDN